MSSDPTTTVHMFGALHSIRKDRGQTSVAEASIPASGCTAGVLAGELGLPLEKIKAVFVNHQIYSLDHCIKPGDRVAFIPPASPVPPAAS